MRCRACPHTLSASLEFLQLIGLLLNTNPLNRRRLAANEDVLRLLLAHLYVTHRTEDDPLNAICVELVGILGSYDLRDSDARLVRLSCISTTVLHRMPLRTVEISSHWGSADSSWMSLCTRRTGCLP